MGVTVLSDSGFDLSPGEAQAKKIGIVPVYMLYGSERLRDGVDIDRATFLRRMSAGESPKTEPGTIEDYKMAFDRALAAGDDVVCVSISAAISKCFEHASAAAAQCGGRVHVIDSTAASGIETLLAEYAVELAGTGMDGASIAAKLTATKSAAFFAVPDMKQMAASGRVPKAVAALGGMLNVSLVLKIANGTISPAGQTRSFDKTCDIMVESTLRALDRAPGMRIAVTHVNDPDLGNTIMKMVTEKLGHPPAREIVADCSMTIATHLGKGAVGVFAIVP